MKTSTQIFALSIAISTSLTACQTIPQTGDTVTDNQLKPKRLENFTISGKMGVTNARLNQSGSAFYGWGQEQERFAIELQGALGIGFTRIEYDGHTATITNAQIDTEDGSISASRPEDLLLMTTGWNAPISQLPYWISGSPAPSDSKQNLDTRSRLVSAQNGDWTASFKYNGVEALPNKIIAQNSFGSKVVMTIKHEQLNKKN